MFIRFVINALALMVAWLVVPGIDLHADSTTSKVLTLAAVAVIFGVINALVKPIVTVFSVVFIVLTLGLFLVVINTLMLMLTGWVSTKLGVGFSVDGFWPALLGAVVISIISSIGGAILRDDRQRA